MLILRTSNLESRAMSLEGQSLQIQCAPKFALCLQFPETGLKVRVLASVVKGHFRASEPIRFLVTLL